MVREYVAEPNFSSQFSFARRLSPAELNIKLSVFLSPIDPQQPYTRAVLDAPWALQRLFSPAIVELLSTPKYNFNFHSHIADSPQHIRRGTVKDGEDTPFAARSWCRDEFERYKTKFKQVVELSWNNQIILLPPEDSKGGLSDEDYMNLVANPAMPAHVACSLTVLLTAHQESANAAIQVVRLDRDEASYATRPDVMSRPGEGQFRSYMMMITNEDVYRRRSTNYRWPSIRISQIAAAHELGHWLGKPSPMDTPDRYFEHIDANRYPKDHPDFDELQYGGKPGRRVSLMGVGSSATAYDAGPWLNRIRKHTANSTGWRFVHRGRFVGLVPVSDRQKKLIGRP